MHASARHLVFHGAIVLLFGLLGLARAANGLSIGWLDALCIVPAAGAL